MRRRTVQRWLIFLLPLFALRAFVPAGFMAMPAEDGWKLVFCDGIVIDTTPRAQDPDHHAHHAHEHGHAAHQTHGHEAQHAHHNGHDAPSQSGETHYSACPFSLVASAAVASIVHVAVDGVAPSDEPVQFDSSPRQGNTALRAHRIRGPPHLS
jgi:hypothetical protein